MKLLILFIFFLFPNLALAQYNPCQSTTAIEQCLNQLNLRVGNISTPVSAATQSALDLKQNLIQVYDGTTLRLNPIWYINSATTNASGVAVFQLTNDGTSTGTAIFPNGVLIKSVSPTPNDSTTFFGYSWGALTNSGKTLSITVTKSATPLLSLLGINILGAPIAAVSGVSVNVVVMGY